LLTKSKQKISRRGFFGGAALAAAALVSTATAQQEKGVSESGIMSPEVRRVGMRLACLCRSCKNTVGDCAMLECGYCAPMRKRIAAMQAGGQSDDAIVNAIVGENGKEALAVPPTQGFALFAWTAPYAAVVIGLVAIWAFVKRMSAKPAGAPEIDPEILERYHDRIEQDTSKLD
jgi:cytochrome c-type biogenesis protein CcmH/NrfF